MVDRRPEPTSDMENTLRRVGTSAWMLVGIAAVAVIAYSALAAVSSLVIPLVVAVVLGMLFVPLVDVLARTRVPRSIATGIVMVGLLVIVGGSVAVAVAGVVDQASEIQAQLEAGLETVIVWLADLGIDLGSPEEVLESIGDLITGAIPGLGGYVATILSGLGAFIAGTLIALFILYFVLADWDNLALWTGTHLGVPADLGAGIVEDAIWSMRQYFYALTITSLVTAVIIGLAVALLGVPLAFTVAVVTFVTSYIPYIGALFSGAFAVLIALGAGGLVDALVILAVILLVQSVLQPVLQTKMTENRLRIHPIVIFGSTIVGAALAGILGATLSAPVVALVLSVVRRVRDYRQAGLAPEPEG